MAESDAKTIIIEGSLLQKLYQQLKEQYGDKVDPADSKGIVTIRTPGKDASSCYNKESSATTPTKEEQPKCAVSAQQQISFPPMESNRKPILQQQIEIHQEQNPTSSREQHHSTIQTIPLTYSQLVDVVQAAGEEGTEAGIEIVEEHLHGSETIVSSSDVEENSASSSATKEYTIKVKREPTVSFFKQKQQQQPLFQKPTADQHIQLNYRDIYRCAQPNDIDNIQGLTYAKSGTAYQNVFVLPSLEEANLLIRRHELKHSVRFVVKQSPKHFGNTDIFATKHKIKWTPDGVPFIVLGIRKMMCEFGDYGNRKPSEPPKKHLKRPAKNVGCPAKIMLNEVAEFIDFKLAKLTTRQIEMGSKVLRSRLANREIEPEMYQRRLLVDLSKMMSHEGHTLGGHADIPLPKKRKSANSTVLSSCAFLLEELAKSIRSINLEDEGTPQLLSRLEINLSKNLQHVSRHKRRAVQASNSAPKETCTECGTPYQCNICTKSFVTNYKLEVHMRTHTGEKPFECFVCKKGFAVKSYLETHMRTHTGEKPYHCPHCWKMFASKSHLNRHIKIHMIEGDRTEEEELVERMLEEGHLKHEQQRDDDDDHDLVDHQQHQLEELVDHQDYQGQLVQEQLVQEQLVQEQLVQEQLVQEQLVQEQLVHEQFHEQIVSTEQIVQQLTRESTEQIVMDLVRDSQLIISEE